MARYTGPVCKLCRREGVKLLLKGFRCFTNKCSFEKRSNPPGQQTKSFRKMSDYALQLREKQKLKRIYGMLEKQFKLYFKMAERSRGVTGEILLQFLECRIDNVVFRSGFTSSRSSARQLVKHGNIYVNNRRVDIPSYLIKAGITLQVKGKQGRLNRIKETMETLKDRPVPSWIKVDQGTLQAQIIRLPVKEDIQFPVQEQLIVELYSK